MKLTVFFPLVAQMPSQRFDELGVALAVVLTLAGFALHLYLPRHQISVEERVKDSKMTEAEARWQMQFYRRCAPVVTLLGVGLLTLVIYDMAQ